MSEAPMYKLINRDLLRTLMQRTGDGHRISVRSLAAAAGIAHSTVGHLLTGARESVAHEVAQSIAERVGVDLLVLWVPVGRSVRSSDGRHQLRRAQEVA